jgi:excisionase family DNA binding protein
MIEYARLTHLHSVALTAQDEGKDDPSVGEPERKAVPATEAMKMLGVSRSTIRRLLQQGELRGYRLTPSKHSDYRIYVDSIEELKERRQLQ